MSCLKNDFFLCAVTSIYCIVNQTSLSPHVNRKRYMKHFKSSCDELSLKRERRVTLTSLSFEAYNIQYLQYLIKSSYLVKSNVKLLIHKSPERLKHYNTVVSERYVLSLMFDLNTFTKSQERLLLI